MKVIILAAGLGTRLGSIGNSIPKCLVELFGETILERQVKIFESFGIKDINIVIGNKGECWTIENIKRIGYIVKSVIVNFDNDTTKNTRSLKLALEKVSFDEDILIVDGDIAFSPELINELIKDKKNCLVTRESADKISSGNRVKLDHFGKVLEIRRDIKESNFIYGGILKLKKEDCKKSADLICDKKYYDLDLGLPLNALSKKIEIYNLLNNHWINVNTLKDLEDAENLLKKLFVVMMFGYTGVGKSTVAKKISKILHTKIYHSAKIRKNLGFSPKNIEEAEKLFDYKNNLRNEMDREVYSELVKLMRRSLIEGKDVILDAGFFFKWQRNLVYSGLKDLDIELIVLKVKCDNEWKIKERLSKRAESFGGSVFNETPSWNTYLSTKKITEPLEDDGIKYSSVIEYDSYNEKVSIEKGEKVYNIKKILGAIVS